MANGSSAPLLEASAEGTVDFRGWKTWYRITGSVDSGRTPLVVAHGGPGGTHDYLLTIADIAQSGRAVIHYDQLGNGRSTHLRDKGAGFWTVDLFLDELANLLDQLGIADNYHLLGQSWGGMLGAEHAIRRPKGLRSLVISNSPASMPLWLAAAAEMRALLPPDVQETLTRHETAGTTDSPEYAAAMEVFYARHVCRVVPHPPEVARTFAAIGEDPTVYYTMNGPSEFHVIGPLKDFDIVANLGQIEAPTLLFCGEFDEVTPATVRQAHEAIPGSVFTVLEGCSHMAQAERPDLALGLVRGWLAGIEAKQS